MHRGFSKNINNQSLLISRFQQKELQQKNQTNKIQSHNLSLFTHIELQPFFDAIPINIGLRLKILGQKIYESSVIRGYFHNYIEEKLAETDINNGLIEIARINPYLSLPFKLALIIAYEEILEIPTNEEQAQNRALVLELCRINHHLKVLSDISYAICSSSLLSTIKKCQEELAHLITPFNNTEDNINNIIKPISVNTISSYKNALFLLNELRKEFLLSSIAYERLNKLAVVTQHVAASYGLTGIFIRANKVIYDHRGEQNNRICYQTLPVKCVAENADAWSRSFLRIEEAAASVAWLLEQTKINLPQTTLLWDEKIFSTKFKKPFASANIDAPEGDIKVSIFAYPSKNSFIFRIRTPAFFIAQCIPHLLLHTDIYDMPLILSSLGIRAEEIDK